MLSIRTLDVNSGILLKHSIKYARVQNTVYSETASVKTISVIPCDVSTVEKRFGNVLN